MQATGQQAQHEQLRDLLQNPAVFELLTRPDEAGDEEWLADEVGEHLHIDQVLSELDTDDLWRKGWGNKMLYTKIRMSHAWPESRTDDETIEAIQTRINGHDRRPLTAEQARKLKAKTEQKTDREKRSKSGNFVELLLSQVVRSEEKSSNSDGSSGGRLSRLFGGGR